jgi:photosystem II stability/assembly factor-like uncharacterized protein
MTNRTFLAGTDQGIARAEMNADGQWRVEHLAGGHKVTCLARHPAEADILYAGTRDGVIYSIDTGRSWQPLGLAGQIVKSIAISSHDPAIMYAGTKPALIFKSEDGGRTWRELESFRRIPNRWWWLSPAEPPDLRAYVIDIALSPSEPDVLLAGIEFGAVIRSDDGGQTWSRHLSGTLRDCHSLKFHAGDGRWAYQAGGTGGGASFSRDGGRTWTKAGKGLAKHYGIVCGADGERPDVWYVCVGSSPFSAFGDDPQVYLYRANGGAGWQPIGWQDHPLTETPTALVSVPDRPGHLYAGLKSGDVWHTADYGDNWQKLPFNLGAIWFALLVL